MSIDELRALALRLPDRERAALAHDLLLSLPPGAPISESEWEQAWAEERQQRLDRHDRGETTARPWREALDEIQGRLREKREV